MHLISWSNALDLYEKHNPRGFKYFYDFHSFHGIRERDLSPYDRLQQIIDFSDSDADQILDDLEDAILATIPSMKNVSIEITEEGILIGVHSPQG